MASRHDGPASPLFQALPFQGNVAFDELATAEVSDAMRSAGTRAPSGTSGVETRASATKKHAEWSPIPSAGISLLKTHQCVEGCCERAGEKI